MAIQLMTRRFKRNGVKPTRKHGAYTGMIRKETCDCKARGLHEHACRRKGNMICDCCPDD